MEPTDAQANTCRNMGVDKLEPNWQGDHLIFPWRHGGIVIINPHGSASIYPQAMLDHALAGLTR